MEEQDSFELLKMGLNMDYVEEACNWKYDETEQITPPKKPLSAYHIFQISNSFKEGESQKWKNLGRKDKKPYMKEYDARLHKYNILMDEYHKLTLKKSVKNPYLRFYRKMFIILEAERKYNPQQITKIIKNAWAELPKNERDIYQKQYQDELTEIAIGLQEKEKMLNSYNKKLKEYEEMQKFHKLKRVSDSKNQQIGDVKEFMKEKKRKEKQQKKEEERRKNQMMIQQNLKRLEEIKQREIRQLKLEKIKILNPHYEKPHLKDEKFMKTAQKIECEENESIQMKVSEQQEMVNDKIVKPGPSSLKLLLRK